ncbi:MAG: metal ABC transporter permease, partial [Candidatus Methylomirabilales bacterium]
FACLILTGIHAYLGLHVIERGVIFVDLALAQIAALGVTVAFLAGYGLQSTAAYFTSLAFTFLGAAIFSLSRMKGGRIPQEAIIGIVYAVSAAAAVVAVDRAPHGAEHIKYILVGSILTVSTQETLTLLLLYSGIGVFHWVFRHRFLLISLEPQEADRQGLWVRFWDFLFYISFGFVVTSSVQIAGVLLIFSYLIVPAVCGSLFSVRVGPRLLIGWALGFAASVLGLSGSYVWDLPTGATVVCTFGLILILSAMARVLPGHLSRIRAGAGPRYLWGIAMGGSALLLMAALYLMIHPHGSHPWLDLADRTVPEMNLVFLSRVERETYLHSIESIRRAEAELKRLQEMQLKVTWGELEISAEMKGRLLQTVAGRTEIAWGDRMVLGTLRGKARVRQRFVLGLPLSAIAGGLLWMSLRQLRYLRSKGKPSSLFV